jgi:hypothetical protein
MLSKPLLCRASEHVAFGNINHRVNTVNKDHKKMQAVYTAVRERRLLWILEININSPANCKVRGMVLFIPCLIVNTPITEVSNDFWPIPV